MAQGNSTNNVRKINSLRIKAERERAKTDLYFLAEKLGYTLLQSPFHKELLGWIDNNSTCRNQAIFAPREVGYKSTIQICEIIQQILINPDVQIFLIHHKLGLAQDLVLEIGRKFMEHDPLRTLMGPEHIPRPRSPKWLKESGEFTMMNRTPGLRLPTLTAVSASQDLTGFHPDLAFVDDIISEDTVNEMGGIAGIRDWTRKQLIPMLGVVGKLRVKGTIWSADDWYQDIMKDPDFVYVRKPIIDEEGNPIKVMIKSEPKPRLLNMADVDYFKRKAKSHFPGQYMMEAALGGIREWNAVECEHFVDKQDIIGRIKRIAVLIDPAGLSKTKGKGDYFAIAVIGYLDKTKRILLDGRAERDWTLDQGLKKAKMLLNKYSTKLVAIEEPLGAAANQGLIAKRLTDIGKQMDGFGYIKLTPLTLQSTRDGKHTRIRNLCSLADNGDFLILKSCEKEFLELFLSQIRNYSGDGSLEFDDAADVVSYLDDPAILGRLSLPESNSWLEHPLSSTSTHEPHRISSRYCG